MGKLRVEPKVKTMDPGRYREVFEILNDARGLSVDSHIFYDLDKGEKPASVRKDFLYVADKEGISLSVRRARGANTLKLLFSSEAPGNKPARLSPDESRKRIVDVLAGAGGPMKKAGILEASGINRGAWNVRIRELIDAGKVVRAGERRDTVYSLNTGKKPQSKKKK